ncbi:MAG: Mitochondrial import inner membrane translocase subunit Tim17-B, partial [Paramarteilia canceri]
MRIVEDCGYAYVVGLAGGGFFHSLKGMKQAPKGFINGWKGAYSLAKFKSPQTAGSFAIFGTLFSTTECALVGIRNKDDMLNPIISGFVTSASLSFR